MGCIALVRCVLVLRCGLAGVVWLPHIKMMRGPINISYTVRFLQEDPGGMQCGRKVGSS